MAALPVIESIRVKISRLIAENKRLRDVCLVLESEREKLRSDVRERQRVIEELERRIDTLQLSVSLTGEDNSKEARARINRLMREIDRCIAMMNRD